LAGKSGNRGAVTGAGDGADGAAIRRYDDAKNGYDGGDDGGRLDTGDDIDGKYVAVPSFKMTSETLIDPKAGAAGMSDGSGSVIDELQRRKASKVAACAVTVVALLHVGYIGFALAMGLRQGPLPDGTVIGVALSLSLVALLLFLARSVARRRYYVGAICAVGFALALQMLAEGFAVYVASRDKFASWLPIAFVAYIGVYAIGCMVALVLTVRAQLAERR
jgi:hypothetical protein